ncbi:hypothetical protein TNCV_5027681 [Trichonephila clavipes]|nr:hypothetical protein TNCV_5027681 [Trichonephila clavipes]
MIIEDASGEAHGSLPILLSLLYATQAPNQELCSGVTLLLTARPLWSPIETRLQPNAFKHFLGRQIARYLFNREFLGHDGKETASTRNVYDLSRQLKQIWQEIPQESIRMSYLSVPRRVAAPSRLKDCEVIPIGKASSSSNLPKYVEAKDE